MQLAGEEESVKMCITTLHLSVLNHSKERDSAFLSHRPSELLDAAGSKIPKL